MVKQGPRHRFKKRFGQNFLQDRHVIERILVAAELHAGDAVVEVGPGRGALTEPLLAATGNVTVCEIDPDLIAYWKERALTGLKVLEGDVLEHDWQAVFAAPPYKMVANLPYNISTPILFKLIEHRALFSRMVLMFQREVGERLLAVPGNKDYGILSVLLQVWYDISKVVLVKPGAFFPPPKVDSLVLRFVPLAQPRVKLGGWEHFCRVVKAAFAQRRKSLRNTLCSGGWEREQVVPALERAGIDSARRAETLSLDEFSSLSVALAEVNEER
ncbi:MAG: ribosomal RNA small subunit methyltransferase A [Desulfuromonas sp.]|nr:MAG: ribosomal RNA small subunit methyltransferase A [Desulfuromonas sp.]